MSVALAIQKYSTPIMDSPGEDFLSHLATDDDWRIARSLIDDDAHLRLILAFRAAEEVGTELNAAHVGRILSVDERTVRRWLEELKKPSQ